MTDVPILRFTSSGERQFRSHIDHQLSGQLDLVGKDRWRWTIENDLTTDTIGQGVIEGPWQFAASQAQAYLNAVYPMTAGS